MIGKISYGWLCPSTSRHPMPLARPIRAPWRGRLPEVLGFHLADPGDGFLGRLGAIKPTTAAPARFIRDQRFGGFFICWSCGFCPAVFVCGSDFAGFCIGFCGSGDRFRFVFLGIAEDDLTFGFFGFFTGSASAFVYSACCSSNDPLRARSSRSPDGPGPLVWASTGQGWAPWRPSRPIADDPIFRNQPRREAEPMMNPEKASGRKL
jgi:hypothetical protein